MADFNLYGGPGPQPEALAQLLLATVQAEQGAGAMKVDAARTAAQSLLAGLESMANRKERKGMVDLEQANRAQERTDRFSLFDLGQKAEFEKQKAYLDATLGGARDARDWQGEQANIDRGIRASEFGAGQEAQSSMAILQLLESMGKASAAQGYPAPELTRRALQQAGGMPLFQQYFGGGGAQRGAPGVPGGYMIGGAQAQDPIVNLAMPGGGGGYQGLMGGGDAQDPFGGMKPMEQPLTWEQKKYELDQTQKQHVGEIALSIRRMKALGDKNVTIPRERTLAQALGLGDLDEYELEQAVISAFSKVGVNLAPKVGLDGKEGDRRALDAKLKELTQTRKVMVPNGAGLTGLDWSAAGGDKDVILAAMEEVFGNEYDLPMEDEEFDAAADTELLKRHSKFVDLFKPAQIQGGGDLLAEMRKGMESERATKATGAPGVGVFNKALAEEVGIDLAQSLELAGAAAAGLSIAWEGDKPVFKPANGMQVPQSMQQALDSLDPQVKQKLAAKFAVGGTTKQTKSELETGAAARRAAPSREQQFVDQTMQSWEGDAKPKAQAAPTQPQSSLDRYEQWRASKAKKSPAAGAKTPALTPTRSIPRSILGDKLMELLLGAGGGR